MLERARTNQKKYPTNVQIAIITCGHVWIGVGAGVTVCACAASAFTKTAVSPAGINAFIDLINQN
jgi:hypothetical protein